jgi:ubiquinone/menaquinone biosynthesis C-methylase UbiE
VSVLVESSPTLDSVRVVLSKHIPLYAWRPPTYQTAMLKSLRRVWDPAHRKILDVGGGTGVIAQAIRELFPVDEVVSIDVEDRYLDTISVETQVFDGVKLPFDDERFDCVVLNNVVHHVDASDRVNLFRECHRVARSAVYLKDHLAVSPFDHIRLVLLDIMGNVPFSGMVKARYLSKDDWNHLASISGFEIEEQISETYRNGLMALLFPNRLEMTMKWVPSLKPGFSAPDNRLTLRAQFNGA